MTSPLRNLRKRNILLETSDEDMSVNWIIIYSIIIIIIVGRKEWLIEKMNCVVVLPDHLFCSLQEDFRSS